MLDIYKEKLNKLLRYERKDILRAADSTGKESLAKTVQKKVRSLRKFPRFNIPAIQIYVFFDARPFASTSFSRLRSEFFHLQDEECQLKFSLFE